MQSTSEFDGTTLANSWRAYNILSFKPTARNVLQACNKFIFEHRRTYV